MMKKGLIALLALLLVITACNSQGKTPIDNPGTTGNTNTAGNEANLDSNVTAVESNLDYCKMILKTLQVQVNTYDRQTKTIQGNIDDGKKKIEDLKAKGGDQAKITEQQQRVQDLTSRLTDSQASLTKAKKALSDANTKCTKIVKKADKTICNEFKADLKTKTSDAQNTLTKEEANLENIKKQYDTAKAAAKPSEFLASIDEEKQKKNLDILKIKNNIDKLGQMGTQLGERCK